MLHAFINEKSLPNSILSQDSSVSLVLSLVSCLDGIRRIRKDLCLNSIFNLLNLPVTGDGSKTIGICLSKNGAHKEHILFLKNLNQKSPVIENYSEIIAANEIFHIDGEEVIGLALSHLLNGISVSLATDKLWSVNFVSITKEFEEGTESVDVKNASNQENVNYHKDYLVMTAGSRCETGSDIWASRDGEYPGLIFLPRVEDDLKLYDADRKSATSIHVALKKLSASFKDWMLLGGSVPNFTIHVTPEGEQRKKFCNVYDSSINKTMLFDVHARFTPGPGRIHFRMDGNVRVGVVAYIGKKLIGNIEGV